MRSCLLLAVFSSLPAHVIAAEESPEALLARAKKVLAKLDGELRLPSLKEPVEVCRDRWGIAHIYAKNTHDLFFAQGFVAAQDRLFQIEIWRRQAAGEMAEILGKDAVEADRFARLMKYRGDMMAEWTSYSPDTKEIATAFTQGINAAIDQFGDKLPIEFQILGFRPKKWQPEDVLGRMSGIYMSQNFRNEIQRAQLIAVVGIEKARRLAPVDPPHDYTSALSMEELKAIDKRLLAGYDAALNTLSFTPAKTESNNWVVSGARSASGKPLLASDPHRAIALPSLRYMVHLHAPGWNVIGAGEPALPGVALGHNERIAWGFTIIGTDQADIYVEETNPDEPNSFKVVALWRDGYKVREQIVVKGEKEPRTVELHYSPHGPVLFEDAKRHRAYALKWVGSGPGGAAYLGSLAVARAQNQKEFLAAMQSWKIPGLNFVYADVEGNIGWIAAAQTPIRPNHDGLLPVPGKGGYEWSGYLPVEQLPQSFNPKAGFLATANHNIIPDGYQQQIGYEFAAPYRFQRVNTKLASKEKWELNDFKALQHDDVSLPGLALVRLLKERGLQGSIPEPYRQAVLEWDGRLSVDSKAGSLMAIWLRTLQERFYARHGSNETKAPLAALCGLPVILDAMEKPDSWWWANEDVMPNRDQLLRLTLETAVQKLKALPEAKQQRWGALHTVTFRHPIAAFNLGPFERPGDANTLNNTRYDENYQQIHGASYRHLFDLADWDRGLATSAPGQSGQPGSPHYDDLVPLWAQGEYFPLAYSRKKVEDVTRNRLWLKPR